MGVGVRILTIIFVFAPIHPVRALRQFVASGAIYCPQYLRIASPAPVAIDLSGVHFDDDKADLHADAVQILDRAVATLRANPQVRVEVASHTDSRGSDAYDQRLSERCVRNRRAALERELKN